MKKRTRIILLVLLSTLFLFFIFVVGYGVWFIKQGGLPEKLVSTMVEELAPNQKNADALTHTLLGFDQPKNYLILFLNNTEIRPGGGFIGAYAVVTLDQGRPTLVKLEGTELLDNSAVSSSLPLPPPVLNKYLKVKRWYFRDSNWSPDFSSSSRFGLDLYNREGGAMASKIDAVVGFTPTVMEEFFRIIGPIKIGTIEFNASNFTERLEYEVEHGYVWQGKSTSERKDIIRELASAILSKFKFDVLTNYSSYLRLAKRMLAEKQIVLYSPNAALQAQVQAEDWGGEMKNTGGDFLLWADANLGALKTDHAIVRSLSYEVAPSSSGFVGSATMAFEHTSLRDWRTSVYRDYARVFVPLGSKILSVSSDVPFEGGKTTTTVDIGEENGKTWFGAYFTLGYKSKRAITFSYLLPTSSVFAEDNLDNYSLLVQKQVGLGAVPLTISVNLGKAIVDSSPRAALAGQVISEYKVKTNLAEDRTFNLKLE